MKPVRRLLFAPLAVAAVLALTATCSADVRLPHIFGDHMVLQREMPIRIWGTADPGEQVKVTIGDSHAEVTADAKGHWKAQLPPLSAGKPVEVEIAGKNTIKLHDVLIGEVWVCSGQSNMQWPVVASVNGADEVAHADNPSIRLFTVPMIPAGEPVNDVDAEWKLCNSKNIPHFTAVGYFFGRYLQKELGVPVGLINTSWGGTRIEPWTPPEGFAAVPALGAILKDVQMKSRGAKRLAKQQAAALAQFAKWLPSAEKAKAAGEPIPDPPAWPTHPLKSNIAPTGLYNGMVHPLVPFAIRGAIWYQGESNNGEGMLYFEKMKALIAGWRAVWHEGDFPFLFVQLAPFMYGKGSKALPEIWEAQTASLAIPNTGMAVTNDVGDIHDIHPKNKQEVGKRLALWALARTYGKQGLVYSGPLFHSMQKEDGRIRVKFDHTGSGLISRDGQPLKGFEVAGEDGKFRKAEAQIDGDSVVVSSKKVENPVAVRFAWSQDAEPNLANKEGLPASAFRSRSQ